jgi:hypothetical protein
MWRSRDKGITMDQGDPWRSGSGRNTMIHLDPMYEGSI